MPAVHLGEESLVDALRMLPEEVLHLRPTDHRELHLVLRRQLLEAGNVESGLKVFDSIDERRVETSKFMLFAQTLNP